MLRGSRRHVSDCYVEVGDKLATSYGHVADTNLATSRGSYAEPGVVEFGLNHAISITSEISRRKYAANLLFFVSS